MLRLSTLDSLRTGLYRCNHSHSAEPMPPPVDRTTWTVWNNLRSCLPGARIGVKRRLYYIGRLCSHVNAGALPIDIVSLTASMPDVTFTHCYTLKRIVSCFRRHNPNAHVLYSAEGRIGNHAVCFIVTYTDKASLLLTCLKRSLADGEPR